MNLPANVRLVLYIIMGVGSPIVAYLSATGVLGQAEIGLWGALTTFLGGLAAINVTPNE